MFVPKRPLRPLGVWCDLELHFVLKFQWEPVPAESATVRTLGCDGCGTRSNPRPLAVFAVLEVLQLRSCCWLLLSSSFPPPPFPASLAPPPPVRLCGCCAGCAGCCAGSSRLLRWLCWLLRWVCWQLGQAVVLLSFLSMPRKLHKTFPESPVTELSDSSASRQRCTQSDLSICTAG